MLGHHLSGSSNQRGDDRDRRKAVGGALPVMPKSVAPAPGGHHGDGIPARYRILYERQRLGQILLGEKAGGDQARAELPQRHRVERGLLAATSYQPAGQLCIDLTQAGRGEGTGKLQAELGVRPDGAEPGRHGWYHAGEWICIRGWADDPPQDR
jgi:hypothetical protein